MSHPDEKLLSAKLSGFNVDAEVTVAVELAGTPVVTDDELPAEEDGK
jgi:hypothetical protein